MMSDRGIRLVQAVVLWAMLLSAGVCAVLVGFALWTLFIRAVC